MPDPADEIVLLVDDDNRPTGTAPRARMRAEGLTHRATYVFVFSSRGEVLVQRRTDVKDVYPGYYDAAAGGVVLAGESYDESAERELAEELGVRGVPLEPRFDFRFEDGRNRCWGRTYVCHSDGPFECQPEEVVSVHFEPIARVLDGALAPVTPDTRHALERLAAEGLP